MVPARIYCFCRKLYPNTRVEIPDEGIFIVKEMKSDENDLNTHDA